jgi:hypothetical protein
VPDLDSATPTPKPTVFLSYASEDREAARRIGDALPAHGLEVWLDESELGGGDAWDQKIRRQIRECNFFMAIVSANTEARHEGYFRREWRLAVERTLDMADDYLFLLPVVIDETAESYARVPEKFLSVQWLKLPGGQPTPALEALCRRLVTGSTAPAPSAGRRAYAHPVSTTPRPAAAPPSAAVPPLPEAHQPAVSRPFPKEEEGQKVKFWFEVIGYALASVWQVFRKWPRWIRWLIIIWAAIWLMSRLSPDHGSEHVSSAEEEKLKRIAQRYHGGTDKADLAKLAAMVSSELSVDDESGSSDRNRVLVIPFAAPQGDSAAKSVTDSTFAQAYGRLAIAHQGKVGLAHDAVPACETTAALVPARASQAKYAVCGFVNTEPSGQTLVVRILDVTKNSVLSSLSYPVASANPETIAAEVSAKVPSTDEE